MSHPFSTAFALTFAAFLYQLRDDGQAAEEAAEAVIALSGEHGVPHWLAWGIISRGRLLASRGRWEEGIAQTRQGLDILPPTWGEANRPSALVNLAWMYGQVGRPEEGLALMAEARGLVNETDQRESESDLHRVEGELRLLLSESNHADVERCFRKALDVARRQSAKSWELRAATNLARLWQQQGRTQEARELLAPVYTWFTEGFDTHDLNDAKALLEELA
jgi:predicted ATPase